MLEFLEDLYINKREEFDRFVLAGAEKEKEEEPDSTGDPEIDELERRLAAGEDIGMEDLEILEPKKQEPKSEKTEAEKTEALGTFPEEELPDADDFKDDYS